MKKNQKLKLLLATLALMLVLGASYFFLPFKSWEPPPPSAKIHGETILEKVASLQAYLNVKDGEEDNFWVVFLEDYSAKTRIWKFTVMITDPTVLGGGSDTADQQLKIEKFFSVLKEIFVNLAKWDETAEAVMVRVSVPTSFDRERPIYGLLYLADKEGLSNIRNYPENWAVYMYKPEELMEYPKSEIGALLKGGGNGQNGQ